MAEAAEREVVMHHRFAVPGDLEIRLDAKPAADGGREGRCRVLDDAGGCVVQPAMGNGARGEPVEAGHSVAQRPTVTTPRTCPRPRPRPRAEAPIRRWS